MTNGALRTGLPVTQMWLHLTNIISTALQRGDTLGSCQEIKDRLKCRICHCKQLVFLMHLCLWRYPLCLQQATETHWEISFANPVSEKIRHGGRKRRLRGPWLQTRRGGSGRVGQIQATSPKSWEKAFYVSSAFVTEDRLSSAQHPAALL